MNGFGIDCPGLDRIDSERRLFVVREAGGYSCIGFDVLADRDLSGLTANPWEKET